MRQHRSFCLPQSEQTSRQARQTPDAQRFERGDDGLSGSGTEPRIKSTMLTIFAREGRAGGRDLGEVV